MPYITQEDKEFLETELPDTAGHLNYLFTTIINGYTEDGVSYQKINDVVGALEGAKAEFQRRIVAPYEDKKIKENGDVYYEQDSQEAESGPQTYGGL